MYNDHNFLVCTRDFTGRNASVILNRRNIDKTCRTAPERGKFNSLRRDPRSCGNNTTPSCACWLFPSPPHTPTCSPLWNLLKQGSHQSTSSRPGFTILHHQPIFIHSAKTRKAGNFPSARMTGCQTPLQKNRSVSESEKHGAEKGWREGEERKEKVMTNVHLTRTSSSKPSYAMAERASEGVKRRQEAEGKGELVLVRITLGTIRTSVCSVSYLVTGSKFLKWALVKNPKHSI